MKKWLTFLLVVFRFYVDGEPQFRTDQISDIYNDPYHRPVTSRPQNRRPGDVGDRYSRPDWNNRYGNKFRLNQRGNPTFGSIDRDRVRLNYNQQQRDDLQDYALRNTIYDRWRSDLQGQERPGVAPGTNPTYPLSENVLVSTDTGKVQGFYVYLYDKPGTRYDEWPVNIPLDLQRPILNVTVFLGIPYAQNPSNEGRFKPPRRVRNWHTTWHAIDYSPACPQNIKYIGAKQGIRNGIDEDCLYLNIFTPTLSMNARERFPVLFYIHGGDFDHGSGSQFPGHMLAAWGEVVVVTINFRLGALGFLSTGDYHSPGNYGLMDMALALDWVHNNIRFFNGDRERITVFGPGAGGAAAGLLAVLPSTMDYVKQVIAESGSPLAEWAAIDDVYRVQNTSRVFGLEMGCNVENSFNLLNCLIKRDYEELAVVPIKPDVGTFAWAPVVDGNFTVAGDSWYEEWNEKDWHILPELPIHLYNRNHHHPLLRYLTGVNRDEAANFVFDDIRLSQNNYVVTEDFFNARIREWVLHYNYTLNPNGAYDAIKWMYTFWPDPHNTTHIREQYIHMLSDALYKSGVDQIVKVLINSTAKRSVPTYNYVLNTTVEALKLPFWREVPNNIEMYFITGAPFMDSEFYPESTRVSRQIWTEGDRNISQFMMKTFANFAKWGNPTHEQVAPIQMNWEPTVEGALKYLNINNTFNTSMFYNYRQEQESFWYQYMPLVVKEYIPMPPPPRNPWLDMKEPVTATMYGLLVVDVAFFVVLCVCCGMWKSANRQRNKALDDLSYYSTENLTLTKDEDYEVQNYLEQLSTLRSQSRTGTINTMMSQEATMQQNSRPITPSNVMTSAAAAAAGNLNDNHCTKRHVGQNYNQTQEKTSVSKPYIVQLDEPSRVIRGHQFNDNFDSSSLRSGVQYNSGNVPQNYSKRPLDLADINPTVETIKKPPLEKSGVNPTKVVYNHRIPDNYGPLATNGLDDPSPPQSLMENFQMPVAKTSETRDFREDPQMPNSRPITPNAVTFGLSMKPSNVRSVGTISASSGLILNTDL